MKKNNYVVTVGNVGNMEYNSKKLALDCFTTYVTLSVNNETRAAGEDVTLFENGEIIKEHIGSNNESADYSTENELFETLRRTASDTTDNND